MNASRSHSAMILFSRKEMLRWVYEKLCEMGGRINVPGSMPITTATWSSMSKRRASVLWTAKSRPHPWAAVSRTYSLRGLWCTLRWPPGRIPPSCSSADRTCICSALPSPGGATYCCLQRCSGSSKDQLPPCRLLKRRRKYRLDAWSEFQPWCM